MPASEIEWTDETWNPVSGCTRASAGCDNCYAVSMTRRLEAMGVEKYVGLVNPGRPHFNGVVRTHEDTLTQPLSWRKPRRVFVNSMSDLFHPVVPRDFIRSVFDVMVEADAHVFQVLTKRPERAEEMASSLPWPPNILMGTSVEDGAAKARVDHLRRVPAYVRFLSCEPLIGPLDDLDLDGIGWVIVGGESGPGARPMEPHWPRQIRDTCRKANVPFFFKQWGAYGENGERVGKKRAGRTLDGRTWDAQPPIPGYRDPKAEGYPPAPAPITDDQWDRIKGIIPGRQGTPGGTGSDNRAFVNAVRWKAWTGRPWRDIPDGRVRWNTAAVRAKRWAEGDKWRPITEALGDRILGRWTETAGR